MRRLRIIVAEVMAIPILLAWLFVKYPDIFDTLVPWISLGVCWHLTWELLLEAEWFKHSAALALKRWKRMAWVYAFVTGGIVSVLFLYSIKLGLGDLAKYHEPSEAKIGAVAASLNLEAYLQPGYANPYPPQTIIGGITWDPNYVDVRLDIAVGQDAIQNLDFEVALDSSIAGIGQISQFSGVTAFPAEQSPPSISFMGTDLKGNPVTIPVVPTKGLAQIVPVYRVHCDELYANTTLHLVIASVALNPMTQGKLPEHLFAPRRAPHFLRLRGSYDVSSRKFPLDFSKTFEDETSSSQAPGTSASPVRTRKHSAHERKKESPAATVNNAPQGIANSGTIIGNPTVNNYGPPPVEMKWTAEPIPSTKPEFTHETRITISVNADYTPVSLAFVCDTEIQGIDYDFGSVGSTQFDDLVDTAKDNKKIGLVKFRGSPVSPDAPLYVYLWSKEPLHVLQVLPAKIH